MVESLNLVGQKFNRLTVVRFEGVKKKKRVWYCQCDCGNFTSLTTNDLRRGHTKGCGCGRGNMRHGHCPKGKQSSEYRTWANIIQRCYNSRHPQYGEYGKRGVKMCERWRHSFENFLADMGEKPSNLVITRKDMGGDYSPENCQWRTRQENCSNRRKRV